VRLIDFDLPLTNTSYSVRPGIVRNNRRFTVRRCFDCDGGAYARGVVGGPPLLVFEHLGPLMLSEDELRCTEICERIWGLLDQRGRGEILEVIVQNGEVTLAGDLQTFSLELLAAAEGLLDDDGSHPKLPAAAYS
jgi:hypothetical protein